MNMDFGRDLIWSLCENKQGPFPPYLIEIIMKDGKSYYMHSGNSIDKETASMIINVWDFRAIHEAEEREIKINLDKPKDKENTDYMYLSQALSIGRLRCKFDDISYVIEWWTRFWTNEFPTENRAKLVGLDKFTQTK